MQFILLKDPSHITTLKPSEIQLFEDQSFIKHPIEFAVSLELHKVH